jgi:hypothetical protein
VITPSTGRIVHYVLSHADVQSIENQRIATGTVSNATREGDIYPMLITRLWGDTPESSVNGTVFLDGPDTYWVTSRSQGEGPSHWHVPPRV